MQLWSSPSGLGPASPSAPSVYAGLAGNRMLALDDPGTVWRVERGELIVFAIETRPGAPHGRRHFVGSFQPGDLAFGWRPDLGVGFAVVATGASSDTLVQSAPLVGVQVLATSAAGGAVLDAIERWVRVLTDCVSDGVRPADATTPQLGAISLLKGGTVVESAQGVVWLRPLSGSLALLGDSAGRCRAGEPPLAVADRAWARAEIDSNVAAYSTAQALVTAEGWSGLLRLSDQVLVMFRNRVDADTRDLAERSAKTEAITAAESRATVSQLASVLTERRQPPLEVVTDPLLVAAQAVAQQLRISVRPTPSPTNGDVGDGLRQLGQTSGFRVRKVTLAPRWWKNGSAPMVGARADNGAPVALLRRHDGYDVEDPQRVDRRRVDADVAAELREQAFVLTPPLEAGRHRLLGLLRIGLRGTGRDLGLVLAAGLLGGLASVLVPVATGLIFNDIVPGNQRGRLLGIMIALALVALAVAFGGLLRGVALTRARSMFDLASQSAVWDRLLRLPAAFFGRYPTGALLSRAQSLTAVRTLLTDTVLATLVTGTFALVNIVILVAGGWLLAAVAIALIVVQLIILGLLTIVQIRRAREQLTATNRTQAISYQMIQGIAKVRVAGAETRALAHWAGAFSAQRRAAFAAGRAAARYTVFSTVWATVTVLAVTAAVVEVGGVEPGTYLAFTAAFGLILAGITAVGNSLFQVALCVPQLEQLVPILDAEPEAVAGREAPGPLRGTIELNQVTFRYEPNGPAAIEDLSLHVEPGEFVAIVGPSGAGKSSLLRLLLGFEQPESGTVAYDGRDLANLDVTAVRQQIGTVLQDARLLPGTIFTNIAGGRVIGKADAWAAAEAAGVADEIRAMPMGLETVVNDTSSTLSGGQQQRLLIARALASKPRLLFFDEATSFLDRVTQAVVRDHVARLRVTRVVIAHRLSTIMAADRIIVLDRGQVIQEGTYAQLGSTPGLFADLAARELV